MEAICAADEAREDAMFNLEKHITKHKRAIQKYQILEQTEDTELVAYTSALLREDLVQTRTASEGRARLATVSVGCEECQSWEVEIQGGEDQILKNKGKLYCQHGYLVVGLSFKSTTHTAVRPLKRLLRTYLRPKRFAVLVFLMVVFFLLRSSLGGLIDSSFLCLQFGPPNGPPG